MARVKSAPSQVIGSGDVRILLIYPYAGIDSNSTMALLLENLAGRGAHVDVLVKPGTEFAKPERFGDTIHLEPQAESSLYPLLRRVLPERVRLFLARHRSRSASAAPPQALIERLTARRYALLIGVDPFGLITADRLAPWTQAPLAYVSFEMIFEDELRTRVERALLEMEHAACRRVALVLSPDVERAELFCREHSFPLDRVVTAPVAPPPADVPKSSILRDMFGIPAGARIVLYAGALEEWACPEEMAAMVAHWPEAYHLVIHRNSMRTGRAIRHLRRSAKAGRIHISSEPVARHDLPRLIASADFGLAPYRPVPGDWWTGKNIYHLGLSSGKVSFYAMCGLPILARSLPVFDREFARYKCGLVYREVAETGDLLTEMDARYADHSDEARRFYRERLNPVAGITRFCDGLMRLATAPPAPGDR